MSEKDLSDQRLALYDKFVKTLTDQDTNINDIVTLEHIACIVTGI